MLQAWADGRITWWEVTCWSEDGSLAAIAAAARTAGVAWASAKAQGAKGGAVPTGPDYEEHFAGWADHQADLLLRHLAGDPHAAGAIDWTNVADEIADVAGNFVQNGELRMTRGLVYVAKLAAEPDHPAARRWQEAASDYLYDARL